MKKMTQLMRSKNTLTVDIYASKMRVDAYLDLTSTCTIPLLRECLSIC